MDQTLGELAPRWCDQPHKWMIRPAGQYYCCLTLFTTWTRFQIYCLVPKTTMCFQEVCQQGTRYSAYEWRGPVWRTCCSRSKSWITGATQVGLTHQTMVLSQFSPLTPQYDPSVIAPLPDLVWMGTTRVTERNNEVKQKLNTNQLRTVENEWF